MILGTYLAIVVSLALAFVSVVAMVLVTLAVIALFVLGVRYYRHHRHSNQTSTPNDHIHHSVGKHLAGHPA